MRHEEVDRDSDRFVMFLALSAMRYVVLNKTIRIYHIARVNANWVTSYISKFFPAFTLTGCSLPNHKKSTSFFNEFSFTGVVPRDEVSLLSDFQGGVVKLRPADPSPRKPKISRFSLMKRIFTGCGTV